MDPFSGGLSYYSSDGQCPMGVPWAGRYAKATDGTIMPGAGGAGGAGPSNKFKRAIDFFNLGSDLAEKLDQVLGSSPNNNTDSGNGTQRSGGGQGEYALVDQYFVLHKSGNGDSTLVKIFTNLDSLRYNNTRRGMLDSWSVKE